LLAAGVADTRITVTPFPLHRLPGPVWTQADVRSRFGLAGKRPLLLLGMPVSRKGFQHAVRALAQLPADVVVVLVCSERQAAEREAVDHLRGIARVAGVADRLITTGYLDDAQLASVLDTVDAALAPFTAVSGSSSIAHFFAAGVPVITSDLPPMRKALDDGAGVRLSIPDDADSLARTIRAALDAPAELAAMRQANQRYSASHTFEHLAELVAALAERVARDRAA
jgi:glycosyltransferase involved in cell wall biosynthesis